MEDTMRQLDALENAIQGATNTKSDVKSSARSLGVAIRDLYKLAKAIGMTRSPDLLEQRLQSGQQQLYTQQTRMMSAIREVQIAQQQQADLLRAVGVESKSEEVLLAVRALGTELAGQSVAVARLEEGQSIKESILSTGRQENAATNEEENKGDTGWSDVVKKRPQRKTERQKGQFQQPSETKRPPRSRPQAVLVNVSREDFPELAKKIRSGVRQEVVGDRVIGMRQVRSGGLLIEVRGDTAQVEAIRAEVARSAGEEVSVKSLQAMTMVEVRDLDQWSTSEEISGAINAATDADQAAIRVLSIRQQFGGTQAAVILVSRDVAGKLLASGRLKVGLVSCRVRVREDRIRCFRCLEHGHLAKNCSGVDRTGCCWRCGDGGHKAAVCAATVEINLHRCGTARELLNATAAEKGSDLLLISEPPRGPPDGPNRVTDLSGNCAIVLPARSSVAVASRGAGSGFAWIRTANLVVYSCYISPNQTTDQFGESLDRLEDSVRRLDPGTDVLVAGDFNAKSHEWGSAVEDGRGSALADLVASLGLVSANVGSKPTFQRRGAQSVIDVTFASASLASRIRGWEVLDDFTDSDHKYVTFEVTPPSGRAATTAKNRSDNTNPGDRLGWACRKLDPEALTMFLRSTPILGISGEPTADQAAEALDAHLARAADACMPRRSDRPGGKKPVHWWSTEIAQLRSRCLAARRAYQRSRGRRVATEGVEELRRAFQDERKSLRLAIRKAQEHSWRELCRAVDNDPWGLPYKLVTKKLRTGNSGAQACGREAMIVDGLFPDDPPVDWARVPLPRAGGMLAPLFSATELEAAACHLPPGKAPGPDGVPNVVLKRACELIPAVLLDVFNRCLGQGEFPRLWKRAKLVLLHKGADKPPDEPSSYRPISLLSTVGKLYERLLLGRVNTHLNNMEGGLSDSQFGFRVGRSTEDALRAVLKATDEAALVHARNRGICAVVSLDVRNAFNSAPWRGLDVALARKDLPTYLQSVFRSYMSDRKMLVPGGSVRPVTAGVPQGSVLGPTMWNIFYDPLMTIPVPAGVRLIAFADDVAIVGSARTGELLEQALNPALEAVSAWMATNGLSLAVHKTEAAVLTRKWSYALPRLTIGGTNVRISEEI
ncbi:Endonuclease/exonuclease/phosphatase,Reverse transcriptase domain,Zinc finger, CCHC-type, partial [Cinara cedri]